ncbi:DNA-binding transcriptional regulator, FadR family [Sphingomonas sp. YR710]|jgi:DNA-binding FadR family transcriptional regulator|nr:DNA-binding transcriptional regulator, FadR family [Sphingomonas sp. YR710]
MRQTVSKDELASAERASGSPTRVLRSHRIAELMAADIRKRILDRDLLVTHTLPPEAELMVQYGVSRPTLREALRLLEAEQLIVIRRGGKGGAIIQQPSLDGAARQFGFLLNYRGVTLGDLHHARTIIEPPALASLALTAKPDQLVELKRELNEATHAIGDQNRHRSVLGAIRERMVELTGTTTTTMIMRLLQHVQDHQTTGFPTDRNGKLQVLSQKAHERMVDLIATGDAAVAESYWRGHLLEGRQYFGQRNAKQLVAGI